MPVCAWACVRACVYVCFRAYLNPRTQTQALKHTAMCIYIETSIYIDRYL